MAEDGWCSCDRVLQVFSVFSFCVGVFSVVWVWGFTGQRASAPWASRVLKLRVRFKQAVHVFECGLCDLG